MDCHGYFHYLSYSMFSQFEGEISNNGDLSNNRLGRLSASETHLNITVSPSHFFSFIAAVNFFLSTINHITRKLFDIQVHIHVLIFPNKFPNFRRKRIPLELGIKECQTGGSQLWIHKNLHQLRVSRPQAHPTWITVHHAKPEQ